VLKDVKKRQGWTKKRRAHESDWEGQPIVPVRNSQEGPPYSREKKKEGSRRREFHSVMGRGGGEQSHCSGKKSTTTGRGSERLV